MRKTSFKNHFDWLFRDRKGHVVVWQRPNVPLIGWAITRLALHFISTQKYAKPLQSLSTTILFTWSYLEITQGVNKFRRIMGALVMALVVIGIIRS